MYERFTDGSREVMVLANKEAEEVGSDAIGWGHLLLGLIRERTGVAAHVLAGLDLDEQAVRRELERLDAASAHEGPSGNSLPTKKFIEYSLEEAAKLNHKYVGTEHMLLALLREPTCRAGVALTNLGIVLQEVRAEVLWILGQRSDL